MLAVAERRLAPLHNVALKVMDAQALDLPDASVDTVTCSLALMLFPDPAQALGRCTVLSDRMDTSASLC